MVIYKEDINKVFKVGFAPISTSASGNTTIVAAVPGFNIIVLGYLLVAAAAVSVAFEDGDGLIVSGPYPISATGGNAPAVHPFGQFVIKSGSALVLNLSAAVLVGGHLSYGLLVPLA